MKKVGILFGSTGGVTESVANLIAEKLGNADLLNVANISADEAAAYQNLILGTSTWGIGDLQDDWEGFLPDFANLDLSGKKIGLFGLGDCQGYPDSFVDGMGEIYEKIKDQDITLVGKVEKADYEFDDSKAVYEGDFIGLPIDEDNESDKTSERVEKWVSEISPLLS